MKTITEGFRLIDTHMFNMKGLNASYLIGLDELAIIETGTPASAQRTWIELRKIPYFRPENVKFIISTHIHLDHAGATSYFLKRCPNASVLHHYKTSRHLIDPERLFQSSMQADAQMAKTYGKPGIVSSEKVIDIHSGEDVKIDNFELEIIDAQGHHSSHYAIYERSSEILFTGDSAGWFWPNRNIIVPTTAPPRFDYNLYKKTIEKHIKLAPKVLAFTHFGFVSSNVDEILKQSIEITEKWFNLIQEVRNDNPAITVNEMTKIIVDKYHNEFKDLNKLLKVVSFEISTSGIFNYLNKIGNVPL
ncbi:MAG: MBL fold metallo-hydrolase [Candidatus Hodarchaeales archaeon]|jgi:glyoxylase-like metal-dependent hydrolase (beta-lactamase superfamily II)